MRQENFADIQQSLQRRWAGDFLISGIYLPIGQPAASYLSNVPAAEDSASGYHSQLGAQDERGLAFSSPKKPLHGALGLRDQPQLHFATRRVVGENALRINFGQAP